MIINNMRSVAPPAAPRNRFGEQFNVSREQAAAPLSAFPLFVRQIRNELERISQRQLLNQRARARAPISPLVRTFCLCSGEEKCVNPWAQLAPKIKTIYTQTEYEPFCNEKHAAINPNTALKSFVFAKIDPKSAESLVWFHLTCSWNNNCARRGSIQ